MNTKQALARSMEHWMRLHKLFQDMSLKLEHTPWEVGPEAISDLIDKLQEEGWSSAECALCEKFVKVQWNCTGCPVREITNKVGCQGTPYHMAAKRIDEFVDNEEPGYDAFYAAESAVDDMAGAMLDIYSKWMNYES